MNPLHRDLTKQGRLPYRVDRDLKKQELDKKGRKVISEGRACAKVLWQQEIEHLQGTKRRLSLSSHSPSWPHLALHRKDITAS